MRIAILGGGTSGFMAAAHLTKRAPDIDLVHIFDPRTPTIGVGEGTTPGFHSWLQEIAPTPFEILARECDATTKKGVRFEDWGRNPGAFAHDFIPSDRIGLHLSASRLIAFLSHHTRTRPIQQQVRRIESGHEGVFLTLEDDSTLDADLLVDARGFPSDIGQGHVELSWIPTNAALLTRGAATPNLDRTRAIARPHGWVFVIPLRHDTSYGYIHDARETPPEDVENDFLTFLTAEGVSQTTPLRRILFPNFITPEPLSNKIFKLGNATSFIEPLEATSLAITKNQLRMLSSWLQLRDHAGMSEYLTKELNRELFEMVLETSLFIGWHYSEGSRYDTDFWRRAKRAFEVGLKATPAHICARFEQHVRIASEIPVTLLRAVRSTTDLGEFARNHHFPRPFGGMTPIGFAQISAGLKENRGRKQDGTRLRVGSE